MLVLIVVANSGLWQGLRNFIFLFNSKLLASERKVCDLRYSEVNFGEFKLGGQFER